MYFSILLLIQTVFAYPCLMASCLQNYCQQRLIVLYD
jgi:hypothetical protein